MITRTALQEITGAICNQDQTLQAVITGAICNQTLQDEPVITGKQAPVIGPLDKNGCTDPGLPGVVSERIKGDSVSYVLNPATAIDESPDICPSCGSDFTMRTLRAGQTGEVECWEQKCGHVWQAGHGAV